MKIPADELVKYTLVRSLSGTEIPYSGLDALQLLSPHTTEGPFCIMPQPSPSLE